MAAFETWESESEREGGRDKEREWVLGDSIPDYSSAKHSHQSPSCKPQALLGDLCPFADISFRPGF